MVDYYNIVDIDVIVVNALIEDNFDDKNVILEKFIKMVGKIIFYHFLTCYYMFVEKSYNQLWVYYGMEYDCNY